MSRKTARNGRYEVAWGNDHACGWFIQVWDLEATGNNADTPIVDKDALFNGLTASGLLIIAGEYGVADAVEQWMWGGA